VPTLDITHYRSPNTAAGAPLPWADDRARVDGGAALVAGFGIAVVTTPAGVSGAVLLLPVQLSVLGPEPHFHDRVSLFTAFVNKLT
jgi:uncharacterized membrane protein YfcA